MGKPRMIILVRHAQSEGNKNRDIHQFIPDHRVKLTSNGWNQAEEAGRQLRSMLRPDDTLQFFTSPYRRTRETTEGILRTLTADDPTPSPFARHKIKVFEEPRLREQDFGNFQPCSAEMERMWQERADYGHFFYRIQNGESAADAYDRISGFNESLWRQFGDGDFPSVCVVVTHGLMTRVFLMKWYHWSVEYFEDLRNVNHCEFIVMKQNSTNGKYILENELRTWSDLKKRAAITDTTSASAATPTRGASSSTNLANLNSSPVIPVRRWGGCANGCNHDKMNYPRRVMRKNTADYLGGQLPMPAMAHSQLDREQEDHPIASAEADHTPAIKEPSPSKLGRKLSTKAAPLPTIPMSPLSPNDASNDESSAENIDGEDETAASAPRTQQSAPRTAAILRHLHPRGGGGGQVTPGDGLSDDSDYFPGMQHAHTHHHSHSHGHGHASSTNGKSRLRASSRQRQEIQDRKAARKMSERSWKEESGMGLGARADTLGDGDESGEETGLTHERSASPENTNQDEERPILREALKGDMIVENSEEEREGREDNLNRLAEDNKVGPEDIDKLKEAERKGFGEIY
ncbi:histidine phosphatase superfamily [Massariosphaeria phaeospora]|uniref:Histidine phosphatase superfamily n=1 Tax=Massariosphaeria phaeospora TaxID=100035 RepID=A0A7C8IAC6_9PLEO|nr:histidine phosphatase superfamily [Massariosphaeria phaeospora]